MSSRGKGPAQCTLGVAFESESLEQRALLHAGSGNVGFVEYGLHVGAGLPGWLTDVLMSESVGVNLHPLDVNLASEVPPDDAWLRQLSAIAQRVGSRALVSDMGYWFHGNRTQIWFRPPFIANASKAAAACRRNASLIAEACETRFRVENPPVEWMDGGGDLWAFLEASSDDASVDICLDVSHLIQFEHNVNARRASLPKSFPWHRVAELHLAGFLEVDYRGRKIYLDQHVAEISSEQFALAQALTERVLEERTSLDVCLEMEPRSVVALRSAIKSCRSLLAAATTGTSQSQNTSQGDATCRAQTF